MERHGKALQGKKEFMGTVTTCGTRARRCAREHQEAHPGTCRQADLDIWLTTAQRIQLQ